MVMENNQTRTCVVIGGRGFIGRSLVFKLLKLNHWIVRVAHTDCYFQSDPDDLERDSVLSEAISAGRASYFHIDIRIIHQIHDAIAGSSVVFYTDDMYPCYHNFYLYYATIVLGVKNVITASRMCRVKRLIYISTADVVFDGSHDRIGGDESLLYVGKYEDVRTDLKAQAEALVLFANDINGLLTCALRPSNVFGPGDKHLVPSLVDIAKSGWAKFIIGSGENISDFTYVDNVAHALICAEEALCSQMLSVAGKVFFISNAEPMKFWKFASNILEGLGYQRPMIKLPVWMVWYIVSFYKWTCSKMCSRNFNRSVSIHKIVTLASRTRIFNCSEAQKHIGYSPVVPMEEGIKLTIGSFSQLDVDSSSESWRNFLVKSKVDRLLGCGKVSEILLWRDEKKSFTYFLVLVLLYCWFFLCGRTFISSSASLLLFVTVVLFGYCRLPSNVFGYSVPRIPSTSFEISEMDMKNVIITMANTWNIVNQVAISLAQGEDWNLFFKVAGLLYLLKLIFSHSLTTVSIGVALVLSFTVFLVYEQHEYEINGIMNFLFKCTSKAKRLLVRNLPVSVVTLLTNYGMLLGGKGQYRR